MSNAELKARKAAVDFVNAQFSDLESLDRVKDVYDEVYKANETSRVQLEKQVLIMGVTDFRLKMLSSLWDTLTYHTLL